MTRQQSPSWVTAVSDWLLSNATWDVDKAREEWETEGMTLLRCGGNFCAFRVPVPMVEALAPRRDPASVDAYLEGALLQAPTFRCNSGECYYVLVSPTVASWWPPRRGVECLGAGLELGVPRPDLVGYPGRTVSYWAVPMTRPGRLGSGEAVLQLIAHAQFRMAGGAS
jgi:hypothetical protein